MKLFSVVIAAASIVGAAHAADFTDVKTVYLLPMSSGLDQYLAVRLTNGAVLEVVTDPQKADAVFTDHIGASLEQNLDDLFGTKPKADDSKSDESVRPIMSPLSRGKGSIFLVDRKTRAVIWSMYARAKSSESDDMNDLAKKIANKLEKDRKEKSSPKK